MEGLVSSCNRWRIVCHTCNMKYPECAGVSAEYANCCGNPELHIHDMEEPCSWCEEPAKDDNENCV
jgi:hypothetical protein